MKNYKNNENNIEKIVNEISYLSERFENVKNIWHPEKIEDYFSSYYKRIKECFYELNQNRKYSKNFNNILNIFFKNNNIQENILFNNIFNENELYNYRKRLNKNSEIEEKVALLKKFVINFFKDFKKKFIFTSITEEETKEIVEKLHFEDNIGRYYGIFKNCLYTGATDYIDSFERASHYEGSYWNVVTDQEYMANVRVQERNLENSWENIKRRNRKEKIEYFYQNLLIIEGLLKKDTFKYLVNNNVYDCLLCYPLDKFEKYMDEIVIKLLVVFACSYFINEDEIVDKIIKHVSKDEFFYDYFVMEFKKIKEDLFLENFAEKLY